MDISENIKELNSRIKAKYPDFRGSYLFGSYARGDFHKDSDIDIVLLFDEKHDYDEEKNIFGLIGDLDYKCDFILMPITYTMKELKRNNVFHDEVVNKGIYYDAA